jgi:hypothetical protein
MGTRLISKTWAVEDVLTNVTSAKLSDPTGTYGIKRNDLSASTISGGTVANPVVITTSAAHGLSDGQMVNFLSVVGMTDLEGLNYYAKVTGQSTTSYALYQEAALTNTVDGSAFAGAATGGTATPAEVADGTAMTNSSTGIYQYSFTDTAGIAYTAYVEIVYGGATYHFEVDLAARPSGTSVDWIYSELRTEIADFLGWTRDSANWSSDQGNRLDSILNAGYLQFIYPPVIEESGWSTARKRGQGPGVAHRWSFLSPTATFDTVASTYLYDLPTAFGAMVGDLVYDEDEDESRIIEQVTPGMIDKHRAANDSEGRPYQFALRPKTADMTSAQVTELMLYPTPDAAYGIIYHYDAKVDPLTEANSYPLGGQAHSETILQSCRDIAATRYKDDPAGREHALFLERLRASIEYDRRHSPKTLGFNTDGGRITHTRHGSQFSVTMTNNLG